MHGKQSLPGPNEEAEAEDADGDEFDPELYELEREIEGDWATEDEADKEVT
jgi:hypothetical protein